jgi:hypothetical protein
MKKIMFNDRYGLTRAVLEGKKTMTRRIIPLTDADRQYLDTAFDFDFREMVIIDQYSRFKVGEELAVAQRYWDLRSDNGFYEALQRADPSFPLECIRGEKGCHNKMFVRADWMPHRIRITDIKAERLQDISEEDAMREGIFKYDKPPLHHEADMFAPWAPYVRPYKWDSDNLIYRCTARYAFAYLIDKISGGGTWNRNPWVFAYEFELLK